MRSQRRRPSITDWIESAFDRLAQIWRLLPIWDRWGLYALAYLTMLFLAMQLCDYLAPRVFGPQDAPAPAYDAKISLAVPRPVQPKTRIATVIFAREGAGAA